MKYEDHAEKDLERIRAYLKAGEIDYAISLTVNSLVMAEATGYNKSEFYYLLGNAYRKKGEFHLAVKFYNMAIDNNPETPAVEALRSLQGIMNFYNKDMYNH